jgi:hypothetical protein
MPGEHIVEIEITEGKVIASWWTKELGEILQTIGSPPQEQQIFNLLTNPWCG